MNVKIDKELLSLLKKRKAMLEESDKETMARVRLWKDDYDELCVDIARKLSCSIRVFGSGEVEV